MSLRIPSARCVCAAVLAVASACTELEPGGDQFLVVGTGGESGGTGGDPVNVPEPGPDAGCIDPAGFSGVGCYSCPPTDLTTLENACTTAVCTRFDDSKRLTRLMPDGARPPLPEPNGSGGATASGGTTASGGATGSAGQACEELRSRGPIVYVTGSTAAKPFLQQIAQQVSVHDVFIVYTASGSCAGVDAIVHGTAVTTGPPPAPARSATYWDTAGSTGTACDLPEAGVVADLGISDVFAQSCGGFELVELDSLGIRDAHGPIQTMGFVVPANSRYSEISSKAAFFAFGFGKDSGLLNPEGEPLWSDEAYLIQRSPSSGTQAMLAAAIGVPSASWKGKSTANSDEVAAAIIAASGNQETADKAMGILAADYIDTRNLRATIRTLAFQDDAQACAIFPDSNAGARDKRNVRDGHYPIWGPMHLLYKVDSQGRPANPDTRDAVIDLVGYLSGTRALPNNVKLMDVYAQSGLIPECAMHVRRTKDGGQIFPDVPDSPCSCAFDVKATGSTSCTPCAVQGDCKGTEACSLGYCEKAPSGR